MHYGPKPKPVYRNTVVYDHSFSTDSITLLPDTLYTAPEGKQLTMTVGGVETEIKTGAYTGDVKFTVTDDLGGILNASLHGGPPPEYRTAIYVDGTGVVESKSVLAAADGCNFDGKAFRGGKLISDGPLFNGIVVNDCDYKISDLDLQFKGRGGDDFNGYGAGIVAAGNSKLTIKNSSFETYGCIRGAMTAGGNSEVLMENCKVECHGGSLEEQEITDGMNEVPWVLGLSGNCRATNLVQGAHVTYRNCNMMAYGWGVLSTDAPKGVVLTAENCRIEVNGPSGYGSYSVGDATNIFKGCKLIGPDYALVIAQAPGGKAYFSDTQVVSKRFGLMWHSHTNPEPTVIENGCNFKTDMTTFLLKGCGAKLNVSDSRLTPGNGIVLQMMDSDDAGLFASEYVVCDNEISVKDEAFDLAAIHDNDVVVNISDMTVNGSFYNARTGKKIAPAGAPGAPAPEAESTAVNLVLTLNGAKVCGTISSAVEHHTNVKPSEAIEETKNRIELGQVTNRPSPAVNNGVVLTLTGGSVWTAMDVSYLTSLQIDESSSIIGSVTVDGKPVKVKPGKLYKGNIVVK